MITEEEIKEEDDEEGEEEGEPEKNKISEEEIDQRRRLGFILARWRKNAGLDQESLGGRIGIHPQTVGRYERGRGRQHPYPRKIPFDLLLKWAQACSADPSEAFQSEIDRAVYREELMRRVALSFASADERDRRAALALLELDPKAREIIYRALGV